MHLSVLSTAVGPPSGGLRPPGPPTVVVWPLMARVLTPALGPRSPPLEAFPDCLGSEVSVGVS